MTNLKVTELTAATKVVPEDLTHVVTDVSGTPLNQKAGYGVFLSTYNISAGEQAAGLSNDDIDFSYHKGDVFRYGDPLTGANDTAIFQTAIDTGHPAFCESEGTTNIEGTVVVTGDEMLTLNAGLAFERQSGSSTDPMLHMYGNKSVFDPRGATIRQDLYSHLNGIIRIGPAAGETEGGTTDVQCYGTQILSHFKMVGAWGVTGQDGSVGVYIESIRRKLFTVRNPTYDTHIISGQIINCDIGLVTSTDVNRSRINLLIRQFGTAAVITNASYGNTYDLRIESPQEVTPEVWREAIHLGTQNYLSTESGTSASYGITASYRNRFNVYIETAGSGLTKARVLNFNEPGSSSSEGFNEMNLIGQFGGGIGEDGTTNASGVGTNTINSSIGVIDHGKPWRLHDFYFRAQDDNSGSSFGTDEFKVFADTMRNLAESTTFDVITIDNVGVTTAGVSINLSFCGKESTNFDVHGGEISWLCSVTNNTARTPIKFKDFQANENAGLQTWTVVESAGTIANTGKFILKLTTGNPAGADDDDIFYTWKVEMVSSQLEGNGIDWDRDVTIQNGT